MNLRICNSALPGLAAAALLAASVSVSALSVTQPTAATVVAAGDDYATQQLSDPWDMNNALDLDTDDSFNVANQTFASGLFTGDTTVGSDNEIFPLFGGFVSSINSSRGYNHPVDTTRYRYFTIKMRATRPTATPEVANIVFFAANYTNGACGQTGFTQLANNTWQILTFDMVTNNITSAACAHQWQDFPVGALRFDPALDNNSPFQSVHFSVDWIRLTPVATSAEKTAVTWTDSGYSGTYSVTLNETGTNATTLLLASGISGTSYQADLTRFPAGQYTVTVSRDTGTATTANSGLFRINAAPTVAVTSPNFRGDQAHNFATTVVGNPWGPIDAGDFLTVINWTNVSYTNPAGSFYGRPTNNDPQWYMNLGNQAIDTSLYRSLCFTLQDFGQRAVGLGSVARFFWGSKVTGNLTISQDVPLSSGKNEYCFADIAAVPIEPNSLAGPWSGTQTEFRVDPHEFPVSSACTSSPSPFNCHDVELDSVVLSPFLQANPGFTFTYNLGDADTSNVTVSLSLDPDTTPGNGNEILLFSGLVPNSNGQYVWAGSRSVNYGRYNVLITADDGLNPVSQYSSGPVLVGARDGIFRNGFDPIP